MKYIFVFAVLLSSVAFAGPQDQILTDPTQIAQALAGMYPQLGAQGVYTDWQSDTLADRKTSRLGPGQQQIIREFSRAQLTAAYNNTRTVFYPFGGADVIFPSLFFPNMKTLILAGLEAPGKMPAQLAVSSAPGRIAFVRSSFRDLFHYGYYVTSKMGSQFKDMGTTTQIAVQLVILGNRIRSIEAGPLPNSVRVTYITAQNEVREVYHFKQNLGDGAFGGMVPISSQFIEFVRSKNVDTTFYKASSYIPQKSGFTKVTDLTLSGKYIVQSDTGLRMDTLANAKNWGVHLFGQYIDPHSQFGTKLQPELAVAYANVICASKDAAATKNFMTIWADPKTLKPLNPCNVAPSPYGAVSVYDGGLPFRYDYAGQLGTSTNLSLRNIGSSLMYGVRR